jgi:hypothetical protein
MRSTKGSSLCHRMALRVRHMSPFLANIVWQRSQRPVSKKEINLLERQLLGFLRYISASLFISPDLKTYLEHEEYRGERDQQIERHEDEVKLVRDRAERNGRNL